MNSPAVAGMCGISYRRLHHWASRGWLHPQGQGGTGCDWYWPAAEAEVARRMARLVAAGLVPAKAAQAARECWPAGEIAPGIRIEVSP